MKTVYLFCRWFGIASPENREFPTYEEADAYAQRFLDDYSPLIDVITEEISTGIHVAFYDPDIREFVGWILTQHRV